MSNYSAPPANRMNFAEKFPLVARAAVILLWIWGLVMAFVAVRAAVLGDALGQDAHAYWLAGQGELVYDRVPGQRDAYLYSPAFLTVIRPFTMLPWLLFLPMWICVEAAVLLWLLKPLRTRWFVPVFLLCAPELLVGNIYILLAGAAVIGMQKPAAWSFPILTKVTAGVGLLWFAVRGEWWRLLKGVGGLAVVVIVSYALNPAQWHSWLAFLLDNRDGTPDSRTSFLLRCLLAVVLVVIGARKQQPWLIAPAMVLASPVLVGFIPLTMLAAIPRLRRPAGQDAGLSRSPLPHQAKVPGIL